MIKLVSFIDAIHDAVLKANDTLSDGHSGILAKFFKETEAKDDDSYCAETISLKYPLHSDTGVEEREVEVPLITLAPISCPTIDSVELTTRFEMDVVDDALCLDFSKGNKDSNDSKSNRSGHLTVKISPQEMPEGLKTVVEGYERALKAQIG